MPRVVHFELPADDPKRAIAFYEKVFGWTVRASLGVWPGEVSGVKRRRCSVGIDEPKDVVGVMWAKGSCLGGCDARLRGKLLHTGQDGEVASGAVGKVGGTDPYTGLWADVEVDCKVSVTTALCAHVRLPARVQGDGL